MFVYTYKWIISSLALDTYWIDLLKSDGTQVGFMRQLYKNSLSAVNKRTFVSVLISIMFRGAGELLPSLRVKQSVGENEQ